MDGTVADRYHYFFGSWRIFFSVNKAASRALSL